MHKITRNLIQLKIAWCLPVFLILSACASPTPVVQTVEVTRLVPQVLVATVIIQETILVTQEVAPVLATATITPMPLVTSTATLVPVTGFSDAKISGWGFRPDGTFFITFDTGQTLTGDYRAQVGKVDFICDRVPKYPERLYCYGELIDYGKITKLEIYTDDGLRTTVFETEFSAPHKPSPTPTPTPTLTLVPTSTP